VPRWTSSHHRLGHPISAAANEDIPDEVEGRAAGPFKRVSRSFYDTGHHGGHDAQRMFTPPTTSEAAVTWITVFGAVVRPGDDINVNDEFRLQLAARKPRPTADRPAPRNPGRARASQDPQRQDQAPRAARRCRGPRTRRHLHPGRPQRLRSHQQQQLTRPKRLHRSAGVKASACDDCRSCECNCRSCRGDCPLQPVFAASRSEALRCSAFHSVN